MNYADVSIQTIDGAHTVGDTTIDISDASEYVAPSTIKVWSGTVPTVLKAVISFTGITANQLTGCVWNYGSHTDVNLANGDFVALDLAAIDVRSTTILGSDLTGSITYTTTANAYFKFIDVPTDGVILAVGAYLRPTTDLAAGTPAVGILNDASDVPGQLMAYNGGAMSNQIRLNTTDDVPRFIWLPIAAPVTTGRYWIEFLPKDFTGLEFGIKLASGPDPTVDITPAATELVEQGTTGITFHIGGIDGTGDEPILQALFQRTMFF